MKSFSTSLVNGSRSSGARRPLTTTGGGRRDFFVFVVFWVPLSFYRIPRLSKLGSRLVSGSGLGHRVPVMISGPQTVPPSLREGGGGVKPRSVSVVSGPFASILRPIVTSCSRALPVGASSDAGPSSGAFVEGGRCGRRRSLLPLCFAATARDKVRTRRKFSSVSTPWKIQLHHGFLVIDSVVGECICHI